MTTYEDALSKTRKLLKLADKAGTPEKAAAAMAQAQKLMDRYKIERLSVEREAEPEDETLYHSYSQKPDGTRGTPLDTFGQKAATWKGHVARR